METTVTPEDVESVLKKLEIAFEWFEHQAVFTTAEVPNVGHIPGVATKNLFLRDKNGAREFLVVVPDHKRVDLKKLAETFSTPKLSFGSPERLASSLKVTPGSVSYLCILNDREKKVAVCIDQAVWDAETVQCHPLRNTATVAMAKPALARIAQASGHEPMILDVPQVAV